MGYLQGPAWYEAVVRINSQVKYGKTVLSPTTAMRNVMSSVFSVIANGHWDVVGNFSKASEVFKSQVLRRSNEDAAAYLKKLTELGVVNDSIHVGELKAWAKDGHIEEYLGNKTDHVWLNRIKGGLKKANDTATGFYRFGDDFWKIIGFENEKKHLMEAGMTDAEAMVEAAERVQNLYPTYSRVGARIKWLSRFPISGTFVSFPAEIIRTGVNQIRQIQADLKSDNPKIRAMGHRRIAGMIAAHSATFALAAISKAALGVSDDEEQALRDMAAPWHKNSTFLWAGRDKNGNLRYFDLTFLDLYGMVV